MAAMIFSEWVDKLREKEKMLVNSMKFAFFHTVFSHLDKKKVQGFANKGIYLKISKARRSRQDPAVLQWSKGGNL